MDRRPDTKPVRVAYFDGAVAYGGSLQVLSLLLSAIDRRAVSPLLVACAPLAQLKGKFEQKDVTLLLRIPLNYVARERWMRRFASHPPLARKLASYAFSAAQLAAGTSNQLRLLYHFWKSKPDVLHVNNSFMPLLPAHLLGIPVVWHLHGAPYRPSPWERLLLKPVKAYVAISDYVAESARKVGFPDDRIKVVLNPAPKPQSFRSGTREALHAVYGIPSHHKLIAHVGRIVPWKGQLEFLRAFSDVLPDYPDTTALIVGDDQENYADGYRSELDTFIEHSGLQANVRFTGQISDVQQLMSSVDLVIHSSIKPEPFGLVIVEAMQAGTAVIASDLGAPPEIIQHGVTGLISSPTTPGALASAIAHLLKNESVLRSIANAGKAYVAQELSLDSYSHALTLLYKEVTTTASPASPTGSNAGAQPIQPSSRASSDDPA